MNQSELSSVDLMAVRRLNQRLADFVNEAFQDELNHQNAGMGMMLGQVAETTLYDLEKAFHYEVRETKPRKAMKPHDPAQFTAAFELYARFIADHSVPGVASVPPNDVGLVPSETLDTLLASFGLSFPELVVLAHNDDPVMRAWNTARANYRRAMQRVGAYFYLASQYNRHLGLVDKDALEAEMLLAHQYLFRRAADMQQSELMFAVLLGGEALAITRTEVAKSSFGPNMGIIQYLCKDERHPYSYASASAENLRNKVYEYAGLKA